MRAQFEPLKSLGVNTPKLMEVECSIVMHSSGEATLGMFSSDEQSKELKYMMTGSAGVTVTVVCGVGATVVVAVTLIHEHALG